MQRLGWLAACSVAAVILGCHAPGAPAVTRPIQVQAVTGTMSVGDWQQRLSGKKLTRLGSYGSSGGGYSFRNDALLCSDGTYSERGERSVYADVANVSGSSGGTSAASGHWQVIDVDGVPHLEVQRDNGKTTSLPLRREGSKTFIGGKRVFVTDQNTCP